MKYCILCGEQTESEEDIYCPSCQRTFELTDFEDMETETFLEKIFNKLNDRDPDLLNKIIAEIDEEKDEITPETESGVTKNL